MSARRSATLALVVPTLIVGLLFTASKQFDAGPTPISAPISAASVSDDETTWLHILISHNGTDEEITLPATASELTNYLPPALSEVLLLDGVTLTENPEFIVAMLGFIGYEIDPYTIDDMFILWAGERKCTLGCVKCCYSDVCGCCCPKPEDDPGKGP